jgi:hypothetical protein
MKKRIASLLLPVACSFSLMVNAQTHPQTQTQTQTQTKTETHSSKSSSTSSSSRRMTMTGCLAQGTEPNTYVLNNISTSSSNNLSKRPSSMARAEENYTLVPSGKIDLRKHVGQKVRVSGIHEGEKSTMSSSGSTGNASSSNQMNEFKVTSIKMIAKACS